MLSIRLSIFLILWTYSLCGHSTKHHESLKLSGDFLQVIIPITALSTTLGLKDFKGSQEFAKGFIATGMTTYGLKYLINEKRPCHGTHSFPSGHASLAFFGSGFIHKRYGFCYAIPAYAAALFVSYTRIKTKEHWIHDIVGGAAIGLIYSYLFTTPYHPQSWYFSPALTPTSISLLCEREF